MLILGINICNAMLVMTIVTLNPLITGAAKKVNEKVDENLQKLGAINNDFALNLLRELREKDDSQNIFISPLSISMAFGMLYYGAEGNTAEEIQNVIGYQNAGMTKEKVHLAFKRFLTKGVNKSPNFNSANAIFVDKSLGLSAAYKRNIQETYFANVTGVDFQSHTAKIVNDINSWIESQTNGKISRLLDSLDENTVFIILNAVHFKGLWKVPFEPRLTRSEDFFNNGQESEAKSIPMMHLTKKFGVSSVSDCEVLELPYKQDGLIMLIMLPNYGLKDLEQKLTHNLLVEILKRMRYSKTSVSIPKFKFEFSRSLVPELKTLGIRKVFEDADFSGMIEKMNVPVGEFFHKAAIEVNEEGTEAAAVTSTHSTKSLLPFFHVNRPFLFAIVDKRINFLLFLGRVNNL